MVAVMIAIILIMPVKIDAEDRAVGAASLQEQIFSRHRIGIAGGIEEEACRKSEPGSHAMFSGRLNGVAPAAFAAALASKRSGVACLRGVNSDPLDRIDSLPGVCSFS